MLSPEKTLAAQRRGVSVTPVKCRLEHQQEASRCSFLCNGRAKACRLVNFFSFKEMLFFQGR